MIVRRDIDSWNPTAKLDGFPRKIHRDPLQTAGGLTLDRKAVRNIHDQIQ